MAMTKHKNVFEIKACENKKMDAHAHRGINLIHNYIYTNSALP